MRFTTYLHYMSKKVSKGRKVRNYVFIAITISLAVAPAILTSKFGYGFSPILTGSMKPAANPGDVFLTRLVASTSLHVGDIIAVSNQSTGVYYSHRIAEIRDFSGALRIITKGDANDSADRDPFIVSPYANVSMVVRTIPYMGRPMVYMNTVQGRQTAASFLVVANILGLFAFLFRKKIVASLTPERVYKELYIEERRNNQQYRELIDNLQESLAIEREEKVGSN
ncbi:sigpep_I_arch, signal peptidase I [Candidatus Nanopelagicaceae bacterium]